MKSRLPAFLLLALFSSLAVVFLLLLRLRYEAGDVYPPYSSLRTDPLGTMAYYESLKRIPGRALHRDFSDNNRLPEGVDVVYLHLAGDRWECEWVPGELRREIERFLMRGGRLVFTFQPETGDFFSHFGEDSHATNTTTAGADGKKNEKKSQKNGAGKPALTAGQNRSLCHDWGFDFGFESLPQTAGVYDAVTVTNTGQAGLPASLRWHSGMVFKPRDSAWRQIYLRGTNAVIMERNIGRGTVALASDSFFTSNEAVANDRQAALLAWLVGNKSEIWFDEAHLGITESPGIAGLIRKYRLDGLFAGLLVLSGLFIWRHAVGLAPAPPPNRQPLFVPGKDASAGFANLLRRNLSLSELMQAAFLEWRKSASSGIPAERRKKVEETIATHESQPLRRRDAVATFNTISKVLKQSKTKT